MPSHDPKGPQRRPHPFQDSATRHLWAVPDLSRERSVEERIDHIEARIAAGYEMLVELKKGLDALRAHNELASGRPIAAQSARGRDAGAAPHAELPAPHAVTLGGLSRRAAMVALAALVALGYLSWGWLARAAVALACPPP